MSEDCFIAINIVFKDSLIYKKFPIIFYWDGKNEVIDEIKNNPKFNEIINQYLNDFEKYSNIEIFLTYVSNNNSKEDKIPIQEMYEISSLDKKIYIDIIKDIFYDLYKRVLKIDYEIPFETFSYEDIIQDIYEDILNTINKDISKETVLNYILSQLDEKTNLNYKNKEFIIKELNDIIKEKS